MGALMARTGPMTFTMRDESTNLIASLVFGLQSLKEIHLLVQIHGHVCDSGCDILKIFAKWLEMTLKNGIVDLKQ